MLEGSGGKEREKNERGIGERRVMDEANCVSLTLRALVGGHLSWHLHS